MNEINYILIITVSLIATSSPGPATLAIAAMSMSQGRWYGLSLAFGVLTGSLFWSISAAFGLGAIMYTNVWLFEFLRYFGAMYLIFLSYKSLCSALSSKSVQLKNNKMPSYKIAYTKGLLIHLTNPKAILFFGSLYTLAVPSGSDTTTLIKIVGVLGSVSAIVFLGYSILFSVAFVRNLYIKLHRAFDSIFAIFFGVAGVKLLSSKL